MNKRPALDLTKCFKVFERGEFRVCLTWFSHSDTEDEPCMVILPAHRAVIRPVVLALSSIYKYDDPRYLAAMSFKYAEVLGMSGSSSAIKIGEIINDYLDDLGKMPARPTFDAFVGADAIITHADGKQEHFEIMDNH